MTNAEMRYLDGAKAGDSAGVKAMLEAGVGVDFGDDRKVPGNRTALMHAAEGGHFPHRSERAELPHSALILSFGVET